MEQICERVAGLDVHRDAVAVCVRTPGRRGGVHVEKARFATTTSGLAVPAGWLAEREVALVAMEATGVYWKPVHYALEDRFEVWLCNAHHVKNVPGRKTDLLTELPDVSAAQVGRPSQQSIAEMSGRSGLPGCCSLVTSLIATETGHTRRNQSPAFSSLPIFDLSRGGPRALLQCP
jgi:hypothetical protein